MARNTPISAEDPDVALALLYAPAAVRPALAALFALDRRMGETVARAREPMLAAIKLAWWRERLEGSDDMPGEPLLRALAPVRAAAAGIVEGWESVLEGEAVAGHAARGRALFEGAGQLLSADPLPVEVGAAGERWALVDAARGGAETLAAAGARARLARWPVALRPLGMLSRLAEHDARRPRPNPPGSPRRAGRMIWHRLTGR